MDALSPAPLIADHGAYNAGLAKGLEEKLFFLDHLWNFPHEDATFVDFGCGDGLILEAIHQRFPNAALFGIEKDAKQRELARQRLRHKGQVLADWSRWEPTRNTKTVLILSSVLHEVVHYEQPLAQFWRGEVEPLDFDVIAIRDMCLQSEAWTWAPKEPLVTEVLRKADPEALRKFWRRWGPFRNQAQLIHFLLKYRFYGCDNWDREVEENYLGVNRELLTHTVFSSGRYAPSLGKHYTPRHFRDFVAEEFHELFETPTHVQMILEKTR